GFATAPGYSSTASIRKGLGSQVRAAAERSAEKGAPPAAAASPFGQKLTWKSIVDQGFIIAGSAKHVREQIADVAGSLNVSHLMMLLHFGNLKKETVLYNTERFAKEVMPSLKSHFSDWEDHWWPKDLPAPVKARALAE